jgi:RNA polymerase sigma factor (TIGR02999 family)
MSEVTEILAADQRGDPQTSSRLLPLVYEELRRLAAHYLTQEKPGQTLQPTALVHEAWLRLVGPESQSWDNRQRFFAAAANCMRRILIDNARRKQRLRHGGACERVNVEVVDLPQPLPDEELLALDDALKRLAQIDSDAARLVELRFFVGLTLQQTADLLDISRRTADRTWAFARAWLFQEMRGQPRSEA